MASPDEPGSVPDRRFASLLVRVWTNGANPGRLLRVELRHLQSGRVQVSKDIDVQGVVAMIRAALDEASAVDGPPS
jgi:hypothetical protein